VGALAPTLVGRETSGRSPHLATKGPGSRRGAARDKLVEVPASGALFQWGKILTSRFLFSDVFVHSCATAFLMLLPFPSG